MAVPPMPLACGPLFIDVDGSVSLDGSKVKFSEREKQILISLALHQGQPMSSTRILSDIWGQQHDPNTNIVAVYIKNIRAKLTPHKLIKTVRGVGYLMDFSA
jgi:DNA-binding response OmpR family regulator